MTSAPALCAAPTALARARRKAFCRLLPVLFISYVVAYVDRNNVAIASLTMKKELPWFNDAVFGFGSGIFFLGYFLLEIPGTLMVEKWSARKWICRIMVSWGLMAGLTAAVRSPGQFYTVRFLLGLAEAGFFPGVIVYLTHWFPARDRAKALSYFLVATPFAQMLNPKISNLVLPIGTSEMVNGMIVHHPQIWGLHGWQWVYIIWAIPAIVLGIVVLLVLTDHPRHAKWLTQEERDALENELAREKQDHAAGKRMTVAQALAHPKVLLLTLAYFCTVTCSYSIEFFMPKIMRDWYQLDLNSLTWFIILPPAVALLAQLGAGWSSDHFKERRYHAVVPLVLGALALGFMPFTQGGLWLTMFCFMAAFAGFKGYQPAFWSLPNLFLVEAAAAGSIGLINSVGNLGGFLGPTVMGYVKETTGSYDGSLWFLCGSMMVTATILFTLGLGTRQKKE
jgi:ACS family tartrate transporter-like MFS transporter